MSLAVDQTMHEAGAAAYYDGARFQPGMPEAWRDGWARAAESLQRAAATNGRIPNALRALAIAFAVVDAALAIINHYVDNSKPPIPRVARMLVAFRSAVSQAQEALRTGE